MQPSDGWISFFSPDENSWKASDGELAGKEGPPREAGDAALLLVLQNRAHLRKIRDKIRLKVHYKAVKKKKRERGRFLIRSQIYANPGHRVASAKATSVLCHSPLCQDDSTESNNSATVPMDQLAWKNFRASSKWIRTLRTQNEAEKRSCTHCSSFTFLKQTKTHDSNFFFGKLQRETRGEFLKILIQTFRPKLTGR